MTIIRNTTSNDTELHVGYTVFHGYKDSVFNEDPIVIDQATQAYIDEDATTQAYFFARIPKCYLNINSLDYSYPTRSFYQDCLEPNMVDVTIHFDSDCDPLTYILTCDGRRALVVDVSPYMMQKSRTVKIKDGAFCSTTTENRYIYEANSNTIYSMANKNESAKPFENVKPRSSLTIENGGFENSLKNSICIEYTVYQGNNTSIEIDPVVIPQDKSNAETISSSFQMIPSCFPNSTIYNENDPSFKTSQFMINEGYLNCDDITFKERYDIAFSEYDSETIGE